MSKPERDGFFDGGKDENTVDWGLVSIRGAAAAEKIMRAARLLQEAREAK